MLRRAVNNYAGLKRKLLPSAIYFVEITSDRNGRSSVLLQSKLPASFDMNEYLFVGVDDDVGKLRS